MSKGLREHANKSMRMHTNSWMPTDIHKMPVKNEEVHRNISKSYTLSAKGRVVVAPAASGGVGDGKPTRFDMEILRTNCDLTLFLYIRRPLKQAAEHYL